MEERVLRRRTRYFLLSLLAHLFLMVLLFLSKYEPSAKTIAPFSAMAKHKQQEQAKAIFFDDPVSDLPASLKPRKSSFGTLAHVDDPMVADIPQQHPEFEDGSFDKGEETPGHALSLGEQVASVDKAALQVTQPTPPSAAKDEAYAQKKGDTQKEKNNDIFAEIKEIEARQARFAEISQQLAQGETDISILKKNATVATAAARAATMGDLAEKPLQPKRKANIIAMTKGFIENLTDEGTDWLKRVGDDSKRPTFEEMKYFSYEQRINWQLQASWKRNFDRGYAAHVPEGKALVSFCIDEQGNVIDCTLVQSSGITILDSMILQNIKAASPFPPLPKHFSTNLYKTGRIIHVTTNRFGL